MTAPTASRTDRLRQALIAVGLMLVVGVLFFFIGMMQGKKPVPELEQQVARAEAALDNAEDRAQLNRALALTYRTALDIDARNFGTANDNLTAAAQSLDGLSGVDGNAVDELRRAMTVSDISVAEDLAQQRARVLMFAEQIEGLASSPSQ